jgi:hypothetical protein
MPMYETHLSSSCTLTPFPVLNVSTMPPLLSLGWQEGGSAKWTSPYATPYGIVTDWYTSAGESDGVTNGQLIPSRSWSAEALKVEIKTARARPYDQNWVMLVQQGMTDKQVIETRTLTIPAGSSSTGPMVIYYPPVLEQFNSYSINLIPVELYSDLNNDGQLTSADAGLVGKPYQSGASDDEKDKGTEFMFANDNLSNGAWDKEDGDTPGRPGDADDDDAEPIIVGIGSLPNQTQVWLEHPASSGLKFYRDKKCTQEIQLSSSQPHVVGGSVTWPTDNKVYVRAESVTFSSTTNPQVEGDLKLMIKPSGGSAAGIEAAKMKLTIIKDIGATKYFHGARDYMLEQNARLHVRFFNAGSHLIRITAMRHESTDMGVIETYHRNPKIYGMPDVVAKNQDHYDLILNGNFCFFDGGTAGRLWGIANHQMTPRCHGGCVVGGAQNAATSVGGANPFEQPNAEYLSANGKGTFAIATGVVPLTPPAHQAALGGFASNLVGGTYNIHPWFGLAETGSATDKKKMIFTVTQTAATTQYPVADLAARLTASGQTLCVAGDGGSSTAIAHRIEGDSTRVKFAGGKHYPGHYWINTYVGFKSDKPRP